ncbi:hypothetical protein V8E54_001778 [Elaphomyces granulatus]
MDSQPDVHKRKGANYNTTEDTTAIQVLLGESLNSDADYRCGIPSIEDNSADSNVDQPDNECSISSSKKQKRHKTISKEAMELEAFDEYQEEIRR